MYLKEISATGFKSFADKLTIELNGKTTCIVGPNGSGKSNIVDAVRWVLGEQSVKSLRGDTNMSDVIFSGSKSRKPLNVATVSLTFDNSDNYINLPYNEVTVKRRVYRSGENEYFINNEKCRLKDITDMFLDSGIGKNSFNIISQGEVQKILSNSEYDRRFIFESAAGVLKYKKRKEEALKKLDKTNNNLERVDDIVGELQIQVEPLKEQSEKATEYLDIKEKLKNVEVSLLADEITVLNEDIKKHQKKIEELNNSLMNLNLKGTNFDTNIIELKSKLLKLETDIKDANNNLLILTKEEERLNGEKKIFNERKKYSATDDKVHNNIINLKEIKLKLDNDKYKTEKDIHELTKEFEDLNIKINKLQLEINNIYLKRKSLEQEFNNKKMSLNEVKHKINMINDFLESGGTYSSSIKAVLSNPRLNGIHNTLGSLIDTDEKYIKALDVSLASVKQFIVVDDEVSAKNAINYLKENRLGRATFFPISVIKPRGIDLDTMDVLNDDNGYLSIMSDIVQYDKKYYNIVSNQLGNVILVDNIDTANRISKKIGQRYKIVTLDGDVVHVGGTMSGGSINVTKSIFSEKQELVKLKNEEQELNELLATYPSSLEEIDNKINTNNTAIKNDEILIVQLQEKINIKNNINNDLNERYDAVISELKSLENIIDSSLDKEEERILNLYYDTNRKKEDMLRQLKLLTKQKDDINSKLDEEQAKIKVNNSSLYQFEKELKEHEISQNRMNIKLDNYLSILSTDYEMTYEKAKANYVLEINKDDARKMVISYKDALKRIGMVNIQAIEDYRKVSERYEFLSSQRNDLLNAKETLLEIIEEMDSVMKEEFLNTFNNIKIEFNKVFKQLFKGGSAELKLTDPKNLLETGIDIIASPPGKKLTSINLLSGGEKTLTAICLIFAILNIKTIPFCLFDEVEAALDEANVDNFGQYLNNYKDKTQFLIITHKTKTMEYADMLYGITMQESGVSKLVSVKLDSVNK